MTPRERATQIVKTPIEGNLITSRSWSEGMISAIERAICNATSAAIKEDRKVRPHEFVGRLDRDCELCGEPDRNEIHYIKRAWRDNAIRQEREACAMIADAETEDASTYQWQHAAEQIAENIRARSKGEKQQKGE